MSGREEFYNLMDEFEKKMYIPRFFSPEDKVQDWKVRLMCAVDKIEREARNGIPDERSKSRKQQIAEIAATIITAHVFDKEDYAIEAAKALYNAGYRKGAKK